MRTNLIATGISLTLAAAGLLTVADSSVAATSQAAAGAAVAGSVFGSSNPESSYNSLSAVDRANFDATELPTSTTVVTQSPGTLTGADGSTTTVPVGADGGAASAALSVSPNFTGTFSDSARWGSKALAGNTLYTWYQATKVSISSGKVTAVSVYNYGYETSTPGWRTNGISTAKYNAGWEGRGLVHAKFVLGAGPWDVQHTDNCGQIRLNADANHYKITSSCDLN